MEPAKNRDVLKFSVASPQADPIVIHSLGIKKDYLLGKTVVPALRGVDLDVMKGEFLAISGPSGSGKTTLLNIFGLIESPTEGRLFLGDREIVAMSDRQLAQLRSHYLGFVFQQFHLLPVLSALENVEYPLLLKKLTSAERRQRAETCLEKVGLREFMQHRPLELSGGQQQRVAIARALATDPLLILADEPTANLDHKTGMTILELMKSLNEDAGTTFVFSTHDTKIVEMASRVVPLLDGQLCPSPK